MSDSVPPVTNNAYLFIQRQLTLLYTAFQVYAETGDPACLAFLQSRMTATKDDFHVLSAPSAGLVAGALPPILPPG